MSTLAPTWTMRCATALQLELQHLRVEAAARTLDGGDGELALAAIMAVPAGARRDFEVALWAERLLERGCGRVAWPIRPDTSDDEIAAATALIARLQRDRTRCATRARSW